MIRLVVIALAFVVPLPAVAQTFVNPALHIREGEPNAVVPRITPEARDYLASRIDEVRLARRAEIGRMQPLMSDADVAAEVEKTADAEKSAEWSDAVEFAERNPDAFADAVRMRRDDPRRADRLLRRGDPAARAAAYATIASHTADAATVLGDVGRAHQTSVSDALGAIAAAVDRALVGERDAERTVVVFAEGAIRGSLARDGGDGGDDDSPAPGAGTGTFGASVQTRSGTWTAKVVLAATDEAVTDRYGAVVLSPGAGAGLASGLLDLRMARWPVHAYASLASSRWGFPSDDAADTAFVDVSVLGAGALYHHAIAADSVGENAIALGAEIGGAVRWLDGDARNSAARENGFGENTAFFGLESGFTVGFGGVLGTVQGYYLWPLSGAEHVDGLTGLSLVAGIGVTGEFFRGRLGR